MMRRRLRDLWWFGVVPVGMMAALVVGVMLDWRWFFFGVFMAVLATREATP